MKRLTSLLALVLLLTASARAETPQQIVRMEGSVIQSTDRGMVVQVSRVTNWTSNKDVIPENGTLVLITDHPKTNNVALGETIRGDFAKGDLIETVDKSVKLRIWKFNKEWDGL